MSVATNRAAELTEAFYEWELAGRGWQTWPYTVRLEPPFRPIAPRRPSHDEFVDDARTAHWLVRLFNFWRNRKGASSTGDQNDSPIIAEPVAEEATWTEWDLVVPPDLHAKQTAVLHWLASLATCRGALAFEILGVHGTVAIRLACNPGDAIPIRAQFNAFFPSTSLVESSQSIRTLWNDNRDHESGALEFGLGREFMLPFRSQPDDPDPLIPLVGALAAVAPNELGLVQLLLQAVDEPWAENTRRAVTTENGKPFFADAPEFTKLAYEKVRSPLYAVVVRLAAKAADQDRAWEIIRQVAGGFGPLGSPDRNELIPLGSDDTDQVIEDVLSRSTHRSGMLWSADEVAALVHPPSVSVRCDRLVRQVRRTRAAPSITSGNSFVLGDNHHGGQTTAVTLSPDHRSRHTYLLGASGTGKSTLLINMILQDIERGAGLAVLDPHGDLVDQVLGRIPTQRLDDVVLFDASDEEFPVGFNFLTARTGIEKNLLASDLVAVFRRLSTSWGDQMTSVLGNAIIAFLESSEGGTIGDLRRFLVEGDYRKRFLSTVRDPDIVYFWEREFPLLTGRPQAPILTRLDTFLRPKLIRHIVNQKECKLDLSRVMNNGEILLAKLAQGAIGEENAYLLGTLFVSQFHQVALGRQQVSESQRRPFQLYIDECHHFVTPSMASILSGARKYRLGLTLANQELRQLGGRDSDLLQAVLTNPCTRVCFRVGDDDARKLAEGFASFDARDLLNLGVGEAICRVEQAQNDFTLRTRPLAPMDTATAECNGKEIRERSRRRYARHINELPPTAPTRSPEGAATSPPQATAGAVIQARAITAKVAVPESKRTPQEIVKQPAVPSERAGGEHRYLQELIKRWGEQRGYRVTIEKPVLDGGGRVDVALEHEGRRLACEIAVTSKADYELGNIQKCLAAGFDAVLVVSADKRHLGRIRALANSGLEPSSSERVHFLAPEDAYVFLDNYAVMPSESTVQGISVKVDYDATAAADQALRKRNIAKVIFRGIGKLKPKDP